MIRNQYEKEYSNTYHLSPVCFNNNGGTSMVRS